MPASDVDLKSQIQFKSTREPVDLTGANFGTGLGLDHVLSEGFGINHDSDKGLGLQSNQTSGLSFRLNQTQLQDPGLVCTLGLLVLNINLCQMSCPAPWLSDAFLWSKFWLLHYRLICFSHTLLLTNPNAFTESAFSIIYR